MKSILNPKVSGRVKPTGNRVLFKPDIAPTHEGAFVLPDAARKATNAGVIVAIGRGKWEEGQLMPIPVNVGDRVLASQYAKMSEPDIEVDGVLHRVIAADRILCRLPDERGNTFAPLGNRIVLRMIDNGLHSEVIVIPDVVQKEPAQEGEVVALGTGKRNADGSEVAFKCRVGDKVFVKEWLGTECEFSGEKFRIYEADEIIGFRE